MPKYIEVRNDVFVTGSVACDQKVIREFYRANVDTFVKAFDEAKKILKLSKDDVNMFFRNIRKVGTTGHFNLDKNEIAIDVRSYDVKSIVKTIIHELTHVKQVRDGKLKGANKGFVWNNEEFGEAKSHEEYLEFPWEIEARANADKYIDEVMKKIK